MAVNGREGDRKTSGNRKEAGKGRERDKKTPGNRNEAIKGQKREKRHQEPKKLSYLCTFKTGKGL